MDNPNRINVATCILRPVAAGYWDAYATQASQNSTAKCNTILDTDGQMHLTMCNGTNVIQRKRSESQPDGKIKTTDHSSNRSSRDRNNCYENELQPFKQYDNLCEVFDAVDYLYMTLMVSEYGLCESNMAKIMIKLWH